VNVALTDPDSNQNLRN